MSPHDRPALALKGGGGVAPIHPPTSALKEVGKQNYAPATFLAGKTR